MSLKPARCGQRGRDNGVYFKHLQRSQRASRTSLTGAGPFEKKKRQAVRGTPCWSNHGGWPVRAAKEEPGLEGKMWWKIFGVGGVRGVEGKMVGQGKVDGG